MTAKLLEGAVGVAIKFGEVEFAPLKKQEGEPVKIPIPDVLPPWIQVRRLFFLRSNGRNVSAIYSQWLRDSIKPPECGKRS